MKHLILIGFFFTCIPYFSISRNDTIHLHDDLKIVPLSKNAFMHISYIPYGNSRIACNGLVFVNDGEAIVLDTPVTDSMSLYLIRWIEEDLKAHIDALVVNHHHEDCLGGLIPFIYLGSSNYAHKKTCDLAQADGFNCTKHYFKDTLTLNIGGEKVQCWYPGPAHTVDNIVTYIPSEKLLFGGCMVKELGAGYGNLSDADLEQWSITVQKVKERYPKVKTVIPGHGAPGNGKLLDYTVGLFSNRVEKESMYMHE